MRKPLLVAMLAIAPAIVPSTLPAQELRPYSLEDLKILIQGGLPASSILQRVTRNCLLFGVNDTAVAQLRAAGASAELTEGLRSACVRLPQSAAAPAPARPDTARTAVVAAPPQLAARRVYSPSGEAVRSLFVPGLGQLHTHRPALGAVFLAGAGGALALGLLSQRVEVNCVAPLQNGACPSGMVRDQATKRPMLVPGLAGFLGLGVISAFEAASGARRANARQVGASPAHPSLEWLPSPVQDTDDASDVALIRLRF